MKFLLASFAVALAAANGLAPRDPPARAFDFTHDVLPILQRQGCSSAYCHGSALGRAGFQLSLFGSDPAADYAAITAQFGGRRIDLRDPGASLLVQKALGRLDHGGERRIDRDGSAHRALLDWIGGGAPWRSAPEREVVGLDVTQHGAQDGAQDGARLRVRATFRGEAGDEVRDVTELTLFRTTDPTVVDVDADGALTERGPGQAFVAARYGNRTALLRFVRPFAAAAPATAPAPPEAGHRLDAPWRAHLAELGLEPAPRVEPTRLARRLYLDFVGRPPTPHELDAFVAAPDAAATATALAKGPAFADVWGRHLARWFEVSANVNADTPRMIAAFVQSLARGDSLPAIAQRVVDGELGALGRLPDPRDRAEYVGRTLLGVRIGCARCHDHPLDRWRQDEHLAFSACFAQPRPDGAGGMASGMLFDPDSGAPIEPRLPALGALPGAPAGGERSSAVRTFVLAREHDQFAKSVANRVFAELVGRGLVEPLDDHRLGNPPLSAAMLDALVAAFHDGGGRLADLAVCIASSAVYAAGTAETDGPASRLLASRSSLPLLPEAHGRAVAEVVGSPGRDALPSSPLARELALRNGEALPRALAAGGTTIDAIFDAGGAPRERLHELWRTVLSRAPRADEEQRFLPLASQDLAAFRDLAYALLTGREFGHRR